VAFDIQRLRAERVYRGSAPSRVVLQDLAALRNVDAELEVQSQVWSKRALISGILAGVAFVSMCVPTVGFVGPGLGLALLVAMTVCHRIAARYQRLDLEDRRYNLVFCILTQLRKDIAPDEPVTVELDFHPTTDKRHLKDKGKVGEWNTESFVQRWLTLQARLRDGTHLRLGIEDRLESRSRTKRNRRGKFKRKQKQKGVALLHVQLRVKPERHPQLAQLGPQARKAVRLPAYVSLARLEVEADRLSLRAGMPLDWRPMASTDPTVVDASRATMMALLSLYQVLNYSTALRKQEAARAAP
jgi:hypothetical protein